MRDSGIDDGSISDFIGQNNRPYMISQDNGERSFSYWRDQICSAALW
jgi:hypothetical protein